MSSQFQCGVALVNHKCTTSVLVTGDRLSIMEPSRDQAQLPITKFISKITPRLHSMFYFPRCCAWTRGWQERSRCKRTGWMSENPTLFCWAGNYLSRIGIENSFHSHAPQYSVSGARTSKAREWDSQTECPRILLSCYRARNSDTSAGKCLRLQSGAAYRSWGFEDPTSRGNSLNHHLQNQPHDR